MSNLHDACKDIYLELGFLQKDPCSKEENAQFRAMVKNNEPLPEGIHEAADGTFYRLLNTGLSKEEREERILCKQLSYLKYIKSCVTILVVLAAAGLLLGWLLAASI